MAAVATSLSGRSPEDIVLSAILEGCIGETVAAVEAPEAWNHAEDPAVPEMLRKVTTDEARHAALAWRFIQWAIAEGSPRLRQTAQAGLSSLIAAEIAAARSGAPRRTAHPAELRAHGMLDEATRREVRLHVLTEVVAPCAEALIGARASDAASARTPRASAHAPQT